MIEVVNGNVEEGCKRRHIELGVMSNDNRKARSIEGARVEDKPEEEDERRERKERTG